MKRSLYLCAAYLLVSTASHIYADVEGSVQPGDIVNGTLILYTVPSELASAANRTASYNQSTLISDTRLITKNLFSNNPEQEAAAYESITGDFAQYFLRYVSTNNKKFSSQAQSLLTAIIELYEAHKANDSASVAAYVEALKQQYAAVEKALIEWKASKNIFKTAGQRDALEVILSLNRYAQMRGKQVLGQIGAQDAVDAFLDE